MVAGVSVAIAFLVSRGTRLTEGGPLACPDCSADASIPVDVGKRATFGAANLENHGTKPAVLERVEYLGMTPGLRTLGPLVSRNGDRRSGGVGLVLGYPPVQLRGALHPLRGYRVFPEHSYDDEVDVLVGLSPPRKGKFAYSKLRLYYRVGNQEYATTFDMGVRICTPSSPSSPCLPPGS